MELDYILIDKKNVVVNLKERSLAVKSINALLEYLNETQMTSLEHINTITIYNLSKYMSLDINARRNLEITEKMRDKSKKGTLLWVLDKTSTSMGGRLLRRWLNDPLIDVNEIQERLDAVKELKDNMMLRGDITETLKKVYDIERLAGKMAYGNANARDMITLKNSLEKLPSVKEVLAGCTTSKLKELYEEVSKSFVSQVPERFIRKQTLTTGERYITEELKTIENQILGAEEKVVNLEYDAFVEIRTQIAQNIKRLQKTATVVSTLDVLE